MQYTNRRAERLANREGELTQLVHDALEQASNGGLRVLQVETENAFP
jgi:hypothetical protein